MAISIPSYAFDDFNEAILLMEKVITLYYPEVRTECPNCYLFITNSSAASTSRYKTGGPQPFTDGMPCPYCDGKGYIDSTVTEDIPTRIYFKPADWQKTINIAIPQGSIITISRMEYATKIRQCKYMVPKYNQLQDHVTDQYYRTGDLYSESWNLNPIKYVTAVWGKNNGAI